MRSMLFKLVQALSIVGTFAVASLPARADVCSDRAQAASDRAYREEMNSCQNGGGNNQCRFDSDCTFGHVCRAGSCVSAPLNCVKNCTDHWGDGSCRTWGSDFCSPNPGCTTPCTERWGDGSCRTWGADLCADGGVSCTKSCTERWGDGSCRTWGADICN